MTRPGPNVTSDADTQPGSDSLFPTGFSGGGALVRSGSVGTGELADGSVAAADLNLPSVAAAIAARTEFTNTYAGISTTPPRFAPASFVVLGDSITADGGGVQVGSTGTPQGYFTNVCWPFWGQILADSRVMWQASFGLAGIDTQTCLNTYLPYVLGLAKKPKYCVVAIGKNNDDAAHIGTFQASYASIVTQLRAAGIIPILCTVTPSVALTNNTNIINGFIRGLAMNYALPLVDNYAAVVDPATGLYLSTYTRDGGTHPSATGAKAMGAALAAVLTQLEPVNATAAWLPKNNVAFSPTRGLTGTGSAGGGDPLLQKTSNSTQFWVSDDWSILGGWYAGYNTFTTPGAPVVGRRATVTRGTGDFTAKYTPSNSQIGDQYLVIMRVGATVESVAGNWTWSVVDAGGSDSFRMTIGFTNDLPTCIIARVVTVPGNPPFQMRVGVGGVAGATVSWSESVAINLTGMGLPV